MRTSELHVLPCGDRGILVELTDLEQVLALHAELREHRPDGVIDLIPAAQTLLVTFDPAVTSAEQLAAHVDGLPHRPRATDRQPLVDIPVRYDGPDLGEVAATTGLTAAEVVRRHHSATYTVAFAGFAPGFAYLTGLDRTLMLPRRPNPRTRVPAGAVAIADGYSGVYPRPGPGGWHLIGHTDVVLWDTGRTPPALLRPGTRVRFLDHTEGGPG